MSQEPTIPSAEESRAQANRSNSLEKLMSYIDGCIRKASNTGKYECFTCPYLTTRFSRSGGVPAAVAALEASGYRVEVRSTHTLFDASGAPVGPEYSTIHIQWAPH